MTEPSSDARRTTPRYANLIAVAILVLPVLVLCAPMFAGQFLGGPYSDQTWTGIGFRTFWQQEVQRTGHVPLWNPLMFGGMPFIAAVHGDMFYPTSFLRMFMRADVVLNITFALHLILAGIFAHVFLRALGLSWLASVTGGLAYQLSGIVVSQVSPGHDGKMIVSAMLPLLLTGLLLGIRKRRLEGYALTALVVGLDILSPQLQMAQYSLICAGLFTLYLVFWDEERPADTRGRVLALSFAALAVAVGFALSAIQMLPFIQNSAYAARVAGNQGWAYATSYAMPPENIVDWLVATFTGSSLTRTHWGSNGVKLHSEYVGAATIALAILGAAGADRRRLKIFIGGVALLFVLVSLGGHTPFYRLWYEIVPGVKVTRAAGMAFFVPTFMFCCWAAFGVERLQRGEGRNLLIGLLVGAGVLLLLGASGGLKALADAMSGERFPLVDANGSAIALGAAISALVIAAVAAAGLAAASGRLKPAALATILLLVLGADLFINARRSFQWTPRAQLYAKDEIIRHLEATPPPYRALDVTDAGGVYPTAFLMTSNIPNALGHHGNELHAYDQLLGGKNSWKDPNAGEFTLGTTRLWNLLALRYVVLPVPANIPGYHQVVRTGQSAPEAREAFLFEADTLPPYARVVPAAVKTDADRIVPTLMDPRWDYNRIVLLESDAPITPPAVDSMPAPTAARASVTAWEPGAMTIRLDPVPERDAFVVVSENWYPLWRATVDGREAPVVRGQRTLITVPVSAGAREVVLKMVPGGYGTGRMISWAALAAILVGLVVPPWRRRRSG